MTAPDQTPAAAPRPTKPKLLRAGASVEIETDGPVEVRRPDGSTVIVHAKGGRALYVIDSPGVHAAGGLTFEAKA